VHVYTKSDMAHEGGEQEKWILILDIRADVDLGFSSWSLCCIIISCDGFSLINIWYPQPIHVSEVPVPVMLISYFRGSDIWRHYIAAVSMTRRLVI
jgi:hypothetical protein